MTSIKFMFCYIKGLLANVNLIADPSTQIVLFNCDPIKTNLKKVNPRQLEVESKEELINEPTESSGCLSTDEICKHEIEDLKKDIKSKLKNVDYVTYIKQFWVGLLEGDGTITVSSPGPNHVKVRMIISIKNLRENVIMLLLIQEVLGGTVKIERQTQYVSWIAIRKDLIQSLIKLLEEYPLLTTRKQCQLKFAINCIENGTKEFIVENRAFMYKDQDSMLKYNENNFIVPSYFSVWLSGFIEAEGSFRFIFDKRRNNKLSGKFNIGQNFEQFLIIAIRDFFGGDVKIQVIISKKEFSKKRELLGQVKHYYLEMGSKAVKEAIFSHFNQNPLMGHKRVTYSRWFASFK